MINFRLAISKLFDFSRFLYDSREQRMSRAQLQQRESVTQFLFFLTKDVNGPNNTPPVAAFEDSYRLLVDLLTWMGRRPILSTFQPPRAGTRMYVHTSVGGFWQHWTTNSNQIFWVDNLQGGRYGQVQTHNKVSLSIWVLVPLSFDPTRASLRGAVPSHISRRNTLFFLTKDVNGPNNTPPVAAFEDSYRLLVDLLTWMGRRPILSKFQQPRAGTRMYIRVSADFDSTGLHTTIKYFELTICKAVDMGKLRLIPR